MSHHHITFFTSTHSLRSVPLISTSHHNSNDTTTGDRTTTSRGQVWAHKATRGGHISYVRIFNSSYQLISVAPPLTVHQPENERDCSFSGFLHLSLAITSPENEHDCSFSGFLLLCVHHQPRNEHDRSFSGLLHLSLATTSPETSTTARRWGCDLSLAITSPENEHDCSFLGFLPLCVHHQPRNEHGRSF
jgi:hypothetical protein